MISFSFSELEALIAGILWPFVRVLALFTTAPILSERSVPRRLRIGLALAIALAASPSLPAPPEGSLSTGAAIGILVQQLAVGAAIGFAVRLAMAAITLAGDLIGLQMGLSFAGFVDPANGGQSPLIGSFLSILATLMFLAMDGHLSLISSVIESFRSVPIGADLVSVVRWEKLAGLGAQLFTWGLQIALPVIGTMLLVNLGLGAMTRSAPQLNLFSIGFPITLLSGLGMLMLLLPAIGSPMRAALEASLTLFP